MDGVWLMLIAVHVALGPDETLLRPRESEELVVFAEEKLLLFVSDDDDDLWV